MLNDLFVVKTKSYVTALLLSEFVCSTFVVSMSKLLIANTTPQSIRTRKMAVLYIMPSCIYLITGMAKPVAAAAFCIPPSSRACDAEAIPRLLGRKEQTARERKDWSKTVSI